MIYFHTILLGILMVSATTGQDSVPQTYPQKWAAGLRTTVHSPALRFQWLVTALGVAAALPFDEDVQANRDALLSDLLADFGDAWGGRWAVFTILPIIFETDIHRGLLNEERTQRLRFAATSLSMVGLTTYLMKAAVGRERPNGKDHLSFPSGHTSISFGTAEVVRTLYGNWWGVPFYGAALITGLSRIHDNKHYLSDVVAGASLGIGIVRGYRPSWQFKPGLAVSCHVAPPGTVTALIRF